MNKHKGMITCYDETGSERVIETPDLDGYLRKIGVYKRGKLKSELFSRLQGSANRSCWFMYFNYRDFTEADLTRGYYMPVCGVKEQPEGRPVKYVEWLVFPEDELSGGGFNNNIFSVDYVTRHESVYKSGNALKEIIYSRKIATGKGIDNRQTDILCRVLHAVWDTQTYDPMARIVILLEDPETESKELLRQLYLLMPRNLRLQMGFMTNVSAADLTQIGSKEGLPIYIMTASFSEWATIAQYSYSFPVYPIDTTNLDVYEFSEEKLFQLKRLADDMDDKTSARLDYVEQKVLESHKSGASSFRYYGEILEKIYSGEMFWWYKDRIDSVEELKRLYRDQEVLMKNKDYRREALERFATTIYPNSDLAFRIVEIVNNESYPDRERLLAFLSDDLEMKKQITASMELRRLLKLDKDQSLQGLEERLKNQFDTALAELKKEHESKISRMEEENRKKLADTKEELSQEYAIKEKQYQDSIRKANDRNRDLEDQLSSDGQRILTLDQELQNTRMELKNSEREIIELRNDKTKLESENQNIKRDLERADDPEGNLQRLKRVEKEKDRLEELNRKFKYSTIAASVVAILFILITGILFIQKKNVAKARDDYKVQLEKKIEELNNAPKMPDENLPGQGDKGDNASVASDKGGSDTGSTSKIEGGEQSQKTTSATNENTNQPSATSVESEKNQSNEGKSSKTEEEEEEEKIIWETKDAVEIIKKAGIKLKFKGIDNEEKDLFFHVKFRSEDGEDIVDETDKQIGTYVDDSSSDKSEALNYKWRDYSGLEDDQGFVGIDKSGNANTYLLHIAFAAHKDGRDFSSVELGERKYIGYYIDVSSEENKYNSHDPNRYTWNKIPGR